MIKIGGMAFENYGLFLYVKGRLIIKTKKMKKIATLLLAGLIFSTCAIAQTKAVKTDEKELKNTIVDKKEDKHEAGKDMAHLKIKSAVKKRKEVRKHRKSINRQGKNLENHGVKDPIEKAKHQAKAEKELKKGKE